MWQMSRDLEDVAGDIRELLPELDDVITALSRAYPDGSGGEQILDWVRPLRDGDGTEERNGSLRQLADHYAALAESADSMGDQLEAAKLNFYIAGGWLVAELLWALSLGPGAPFAHAAVIAGARIAFRAISNAFIRRVSQIIARLISKKLSQVVAKRIGDVVARMAYEVVQEALIETLQGTSQELLVQTIQNANGHVDGYDWGQVGLNAAVSAVAGGAGGLVGFGAGNVFRTDRGGWHGAANGAVTGALAGTGGALAAYGATGLFTGNWDFDPRSLTGGAISGAGPSAIYGGRQFNEFGGAPDLAGVPDGSVATVPASGEVPDSGIVDGTGSQARDVGAQDGAELPRADSGTDGGSPVSPEGEAGGDGVVGEHAPPEATGADPRSESPGERVESESPGEHAPPEADNDGVPAEAQPAARSESSAATSTGSPDGSGQVTPAAHTGTPAPDAAPPADAPPADPSSPPATESAPAAGLSPGQRTDAPEVATDTENSSSAPSSGTHRTDAPATTAPDANTADHRPETSRADAPADQRAGTPASATPTTPIVAAPTGSTTPSPTVTASGTAAPVPSTPGSTPSGSSPASGSLLGGSPSGNTAPGSSPLGTTPPGSAATTGPAPGSSPANPQPPGTPRPSSPTPLAPYRAGAAPLPGTSLPGPQATSTGAEVSPAPRTETVLPIVVDGSTPPSRLGAAAPVGSFRGDARDPGTRDLTQQDLNAEIDNNLLTIAPPDVAWNREERRFVLPDGRTVDLRVEPTEDDAAADFLPSDAGFTVRVSPRAETADVVRALGHELAEIRATLDPEIALDPTTETPGVPTTHLTGRFAEIRILLAHIDRATFDPGRAADLPRLRTALHDLTRHLGLPDSGTTRQLLHAAAPEVATRLALQEQGLLDLRPRFDPHLDPTGFDDAAAAHLDRLADLLSGPHAADVLAAERAGLDGRMREEAARRIFDPIFTDRETAGARRTVRTPDLLSALDPINAALNDPALRGPSRATALRAAVDTFLDGMPPEFREALGPEGAGRMRAAADAFATGPDRLAGVLDQRTGQLTTGDRTVPITDFLHAVDRANRGAAAHGINAEYTVVVHDPVDGRSAVEILPRPRPQHRLPMDQNVFGADDTPIPTVHRPPTGVPGHTVDVGVGRSAFAVTMTPPSDRGDGALILKTELASDFPVAGQRRRSLGVLDPGPLTEPGTLMVFGDLLFAGHALGDNAIARIFVNNVSAHLPPAAYDALAAELARSLAPGGRIELQWDTKPEKAPEDGGLPNDRGHIDGDKLWAALEQLYKDGPMPFRRAERTEFPPPGNTDHDYTIDSGASNTLNTAKMATFSAPRPDHRMVIVHEPPPPEQAASDRQAPGQPAPEQATPEQQGSAEPAPDSAPPPPTAALPHDHTAASLTPETKQIADLSDHPGVARRDGLIAEIDGRPVQEHVDRMARDRADRFRAANELTRQRPGEHPKRTEKRVRILRRTGEYVSSKSHGAVSAVVTDLRTGAVFEGLNGPRDDVIPLDDLHPTLRDTIDAMVAAGRQLPGGGYPALNRAGEPEPGHPTGVRPHPHFDDPYGHAEVKAANEALWAREDANEHRRAQGLPELPTGPDALRELYSQTYKPFDSDGPAPTPYCANCHHSMGHAGNYSGRYTGFPPREENLIDAYDPGEDPA